jgi:hypothetical protein
VRTALVALLALVAAGCTSGKGRQAQSNPVATASYLDLGRYVCAPQSHQVACERGVTRGTGYAYVLETHCGILGAYFDGRLWVAAPPLSDGSGNPPRGWGNPFQRGTMRLTSPDQAEFRAGRLRATFAPAPAGYRFGPCE